MNFVDIQTVITRPEASLVLIFLFLGRMFEQVEVVIPGTANIGVTGCPIGILRELKKNDQQTTQDGPLPSINYQPRIG